MSQPLSNQLARRVIAEAQKRRQKFQPKSIDWFKDSFPAQKAFVTDPNPFKVAHCARRAAKSYSAGLGMYIRAYDNPGVKCFYVTTTLGEARNIMWDDVIKKIADDFGFKEGTDIFFNEARLEARLSNGSILKLMGMDANPKQKRKLLGGKYKLVVLDEVAFFQNDIEEAITKAIIPALADHRGELWLISTCSDNTRGLFYELTKGAPGMINGYSVHRWSWKDNPHTRTQVQETIDRLIANNPLVVNTSAFKQHYLNEWYIDEKNLVYRFDKELNTITELPKLTSWMLGVDLGLYDATAFVVGGWNDTDKTLYIVEAAKESGLDFTDVANRIHYYQSRFKTDLVVIDGANAQGVEEMQRRHGLSLENAQKKAKWDYIRLMNADLQTGRIKLHRQNAKLLGLEWEQLTKDPHSRVPKENPSADNHLADACLYLWRESYSFLSEPLVPKKQKTPAEQAAYEEQRMLDHFMEEVKQRERESELYDVDMDYFKL